MINENLLEENSVIESETHTYSVYLHLSNFNYVSYYIKVFNFV